MAVAKEIRELREEFTRETTLPHSRPGQGHTQYYAEHVEIKYMEQQQEIERLKSRIVELEGKGKRCYKCKNRHRAHNISCVLICCENVDPVRNNTEVSHYVPTAPEGGVDPLITPHTTHEPH